MKNAMQINLGSAISGSEISIHHPTGTTIAQAHAAAKALAGLYIRETFRQVNGTISSFGYAVKS